MISSSLVSAPDDASGDASLPTVAHRAYGIPKGFTSFDPTTANRLRLALQRHFQLVWRALRRFGVEPATVDDAAQQVFLTLASRLSDVEPEMERAFLIGVCSGVAANARRRQSRVVEISDEEADEQADVEGLTPEQLVEWKQRRRVLDQALDALIIEQRTVFVLFELEGFSLPEIAESLSIPLGTATSRLRRAREAFVLWVERNKKRGGAR